LYLFVYSLSTPASREDAKRKTEPQGEVPDGADGRAEEPSEDPAQKPAYSETEELEESLQQQTGVNQQFISIYF
jgi:hypothetical protein